MTKTHLVELLVEANKQISNVITKMENDDGKNNQPAIDGINNVIRQLDEVVEQLEKK